MKNCFIYLRVSTDEQASQGFSIENQKRSCTEYAENNGYYVKKIFIEDGKSGTNVSGRPAFQEMMKILREQPVDAIVVLKIDRIARNVGDFYNIRKELRNMETGSISK